MFDKRKHEWFLSILFIFSNAVLAVLWFNFFPLKSSFDIGDISTKSLLFIVCTVAFFMTIKKLGGFAAMALIVLSNGLLVNLLDELTLEKRIIADIIENLLQLTGFPLFLIATCRIYIRARKRRMMFQNLFDHTNDMVFFVDANGRLLEANKRFYTALGYEPQELKEAHFNDFIHCRIRNITDIFHTRQPLTCEMELVRKDGTTIPAEVSVAFIEEYVYLQCIARDISKHKELEFRLSKERKRFEEYFETAQVMNLVLDRNGCVKMINQKGCEILGHSKEEIIGKDWFENFLPLHVKDEVKGVFHKVLNGEIEAVEFFENPVLTSSGKEVMVSWHNSIIKNERGEPEEILSSGIDVTTHVEYRKRMENHIKFARKLLEMIRTILDIKPDTDSREIFEKIMDMTVNMIPNVQAGTLILKQDDGSYHFIAVSGLDMERLSKVSFTAEEVKRLVSEGPIIVKDWRRFREGMDEKRQEYLSTGIRYIKTTLVVPILFKGEILGYFTLDNFNDSDAFDNEALEMARILGAQTAVLMKKLELEKDLLFLSSRDFLTSLLNRRSFEEQATRMLALVRRENQRCCVMYMDIDRFKAINDHFGHAMGDRILQEVSRIFRDRLRESDLIARIGGDEFIALLPDTDAEGARVVAERVGRDLLIDIEKGKEPLSVKISVGISEFPSNSEQLEELVKMADHAMYFAKKNRTGYAIYSYIRDKIEQKISRGE
ncbi:MAG: diguanylate cyclase [Thermotogae bacterium]|nr:diguanylate cyclase [Thermotogota bacterium]